MTAGILALGTHIPPNVITNAQVSASIGFPEDWIVRKTGIKARRYASPDQITSDLAHDAVLDMLARSPNALDGVAMIIVARSTPDRPMPATSATLQDLLGLTGVPFLDLDAVCAGFLYALRVAEGLVATMEPHERVLVVAADMYSRIVDPTDRRSAPIFSDGATAAVIGQVEEPYGLLSLVLAGHGNLRHLVTIPAGGTERPLTADGLAAGQHHFHMEGRPVAEYVMDTLPGLIKQACERAAVTLDDVDRWVCHQANPNLLVAAAERMGIDPKKFVLTGPDLGNCGAASLPTALAVSHRNGDLADGALLGLAAIGGGMGAGAGVLRWGTGRSVIA